MRRYIDVDKLKRDVEERDDGFWTRYKVFESIIAEQPLADVRENVRGEWVVMDNPGTGWYRVTCSKCGEDVTSIIPMIGFFPDAKPLWNFCPYCGADMRGEKNG